MPSAVPQRNPSPLARGATESSTRWSAGLLFVLYQAGPYVIALVALGIAVGLGVTEHPFLGLQAFTAFFLPVMAGSYVLMLFEDKIAVTFAKAQQWPLLVVVFLGTVFIGRFVLAGHGESNCQDLWMKIIRRLSPGAVPRLVDLRVVRRVCR